MRTSLRNVEDDWSDNYRYEASISHESTWHARRSESGRQQESNFKACKIRDARAVLEMIENLMKLKNLN